jgi:hypothetical protein
MDLIAGMGLSYMNTHSESTLKISQKFFGPNYAGRARGAETERAKRFREILLQLIKDLMPDMGASTLEPASISLVRV